MYITGVVKEFLKDEENQDLINLCKFKEVYEKALSEFVNKFYVWQLFRTLLDADIPITTEDILPGFPNYLSYPELKGPGEFPFILLNSKFTDNII